jgi:uncharacterized membrane protein
MTETDADTVEIASDPREEQALERLVLFTDAVIAIVITLMVLEVKPPPVHSEQELLPALGALHHEYLAVGVSFLVIGIYWAAHHHRFQWVQRLDRGLIAINLLFLLSICAIPFVTAVLAKHPQRIGTILYALTVALASLLLALMWAYACGRKLTAVDLPAHERRSGIVAPLATAAVFLGSIPIAFWNPTAARFSWIAVLVVAIVLRLPSSK